MAQEKTSGGGRLFAKLLLKLDKQQRLPRWRRQAVDFINQRPLLKTLAKIALISYTVVTLVSQLVSFPAFSAGLARKNSVLANDYAAAVACVEKNKYDQPCTLAETKSLKKAWDNDILMCYGHGTACIADKFLGMTVTPKPPALVSP